jgi:uncharacterized protein
LPILPITRRKFIVLAAAASTGALAIDSAIFEPNRPRIVRQDVALSRWPQQLEGFTIALLSDFHYDPYCSVHPLKAAIGMVNNLRPDLIALTGDFVSAPWFSSDAKAASVAEPCAELLRQMKAPHGLWAALGNHDFFTNPGFVTGTLRAAGIQVLINQSVAIEANGGRFWLGGVNDLLGGRADIRATLQPIQAGEPTILMAHEPDYADFVARHPVDLQLSGHTHGGQVRFPFVGALYLPDLGKKYISGLYRIGPLTLYTNPGLGTIQVPIRLNCPPEITLLTVRRSVV